MTVRVCVVVKVGCWQESDSKGALFSVVTETEFSKDRSQELESTTVSVRVVVTMTVSWSDEADVAA